ncbi:hypothetical protein ZD74_004068 [Salmonella enterica subsp. arizonae]|nr:hypothetical protein [Salmonella enterica]ECC1653522.1 hypothetical protein [Salmonella enterica subsp. arizonae]EDY0806474.1 hypothetical protein [Salmonella enterica subsp. arizonae serovar 62:z4,z23:-]EEE2583460.1 hypothetical protein [Salmonella enterica subsp. arizonae serovar 56:z4,z23:-]ECC7019949.1 hypothetical protein [Salmonella enterica]
MRSIGFRLGLYRGKRQEEHIKLATEYGKTQLNMGYLVNSQREKRGAGFELRLNGWEKRIRSG